MPDEINFDKIKKEIDDLIDKLSDEKFERISVPIEKTDLNLSNRILRQRDELICNPRALTKDKYNPTLGLFGLTPEKVKTWELVVDVILKIIMSAIILWLIQFEISSILNFINNPLNALKIDSQGLTAIFIGIIAQTFYLANIITNHIFPNKNNISNPKKSGWGISLNINKPD